MDRHDLEQCSFPDHLTARQLAAALGISEMSVQRWQRTGGLPFISWNQSGGHRYDLAEIIEWLDRRPWYRRICKKAIG